MKIKYINCPILLVLFLILSSSCDRKIAPASSKGNIEKTYDQAEFNFVYVEALKQKLFGNGGEALKYLEKCLKINPSSDAAYYQMAQIVVSAGDLQNGKKYTLKALSIEDKNLWYLIMLAGIYYQDKNLDSAIIYYEKAVRIFPENENIQLALGNLYSENRNFVKAAALFDSFDLKYGVNEASTLSAVKSLMENHQYDAALEKTKMLIEKYPEKIIYSGLMADIYRGKGDTLMAMEVYNKLVDKDPDNPQVLLSLCDFLLTEKRYEEVFVLINKIILNSNVTREEKIQLVARMLEIPDLVTSQGNSFYLSLMVLEANYKDDGIVVLLRPELLLKENKLIEASLRLEEIIAKTPDNYYAWEKLLFTYLQLKDYNKLMSRAEECASKFNMSFVAKILYANAAMENKKFDIAIEELRKAEIIAGSNNEYLIQVLTMRADVYYRLKDYTKAFGIFDQALLLNKDDLTVINNYAYFLAEQNTRLKEAEEMAKKVIDTEKTNTTFLDTYAWVLYKRGKVKEAAKIMEAIISSGEKPDAEWYEHYGYILKKQKKCLVAIDNWNIALTIDKSKTHLIKEIEDCRK